MDSKGNYFNIAFVTAWLYCRLGAVIEMLGSEKLYNFAKKLS